tara:strand:+ start:3173 stop:3562 length:390 start_codon:yes stop_codon:yes gene_type:complete
MSKENNNKQGVLAKGMYVRSHTFASGTTVPSLSIDIEQFCSFAKENVIIAENGKLYLNLKLIPSKDDKSKFSHTPIVNDFFKSAENSEEAFDTLVSQMFPEEIDEMIAEKEQIIIKSDKKASRKSKVTA